MTSRSAVALECRTAALDFMAGVADGWTKLDLALWLSGPYALAARYAQGRDLGAPSRPIAADTLENLLVQTRSHILAGLELAALPRAGRFGFVEDALIHHHVVRVPLADAIWVPVDRARMRLRDRVQSLFVADCLNAPDDYQHLYVCHHCERIVFEPGARDRGGCGEHRISGFIEKKTERGPRKTLTYRR
jgi:hypothetical protein